MKHRLSIGVLSSLVILILVLSACTTTTPATSTTPVNTTTASTTSSAVTPTTATSTTASTTASIPVSTTTAAQAKWWDKFGKPKYGGTIVMPTASIGNVIFGTTTISSAAAGSSGLKRYGLMTGLWTAISGASIHHFTRKIPCRTSGRILGTAGWTNGCCPPASGSAFSEQSSR